MEEGGGRKMEEGDGKKQGGRWKMYTHHLLYQNRTFVCLSSLPHEGWPWAYAVEGGGGGGGGGVVVG